MSDIYCGIGKVPNGKTLGTARQCAEHSQVRMYGIKKIDPKTLALIKQKDIVPESTDKVRLLIAEQRGKIKRFKGLYETTKTDKKNEYYETWQKAETTLAKAIAKYKEILTKKEGSAKKTSVKKASVKKASVKKASVKKAPVKKASKTGSAKKASVKKDSKTGSVKKASIKKASVKKASKTGSVKKGSVKKVAKKTGAVAIKTKIGVKSKLSRTKSKAIATKNSIKRSSNCPPCPPCSK